jgi:hypothetical protein
MRNVKGGLLVLLKVSKMEMLHIEGEEKKSFLFLLLAISFIVLVCLRDIFGFVVNPNLFILFTLFYLPFADRTELVAIACFVMPFADAFNTNIIYGLILIALLVRILVEDKKMNFSTGILPSVLILIYEFMHAFYEPFSFDQYIVYLIVYMLLNIAIFMPNPKFDYLFIIKAFIWSVLVTNTIIFINTIRLYSFNDIIYNGVRVGTLETLDTSNIYFLSDNVNAIGLKCILVVAIISVLLLNGKIRMRLLYIIIGCIIAIYGLLTLSKTYLLTLVFIISFIIIVEICKFRKRISFKYIILISFIGITLFFMRSIFSVLINNIFTRFEVSGLSARDIVFKMYNEFIFGDMSQFFWGIGIQHIAKKAQLPFSPHNAIQEVFVAWGVVGLLLVLYFFNSYLKNIKKVLKRKHLNLLSFAPILALIISTMASRIFSQYWVLISLIAIYGCIYLCNMRSDDKQIPNQDK